MRQRPTDGIEGLAPHDDGVACGRALEESQIFRQAPGQGVTQANAMVTFGSNNQREFSGHEMKSVDRADEWQKSAFILADIARARSWP